jgi:hypothetical protein
MLQEEEFLKNQKNIHIMCGDKVIYIAKDPKSPPEPLTTFLGVNKIGICEESFKSKCMKYNLSKIDEISLMGENAQSSVDYIKNLHKEKKINLNDLKTKIKIYAYESRKNKVSEEDKKIFDIIPSRSSYTSHISLIKVDGKYYSFYEPIHIKKDGESDYFGEFFDNNQEYIKKSEDTNSIEYYMLPKVFEVSSKDKLEQINNYLNNL